MNLYPRPRKPVEQSKLPSYLTCPWCPAQSLHTRSCFFVQGITRAFQYVKYVCPANHEFWVQNNVLPMRMQEGQ